VNIYEYIEQNRESLIAFIRLACRNAPVNLTDNDIRGWILNDAAMYNVAYVAGVEF
jgi:hypothetical protein